MKRRILSILTALALCLSLLPATALAEEVDLGPWPCGKDGADVTATLSEDGTLTISGTGAMADYTSMTNSRPWDGQRGSIQEVVIQDSVTSIGEYAFYKCTNLTSIQLPSSLTSIAQHAFDQCSNLTSVEIPENVQNIDTRAFSDCTSLTSVKILDGGIDKTIGQYLFRSCTNLTRVDIPASVKIIGSNAFYGCEKVEVYYAGTLEQWENLNGSKGCGTSNVYGAPHAVTVEDGGSTGSTGAGNWNEGKTVTVYAGAKAGYAFDRWAATGVTLENTASQTVSFKMPPENVTLTATWRELTEADYVAQVTQGGATSSYATLEDAWKSLPDGNSTVTLLKSAEIREPLVVDSGKNVTVEMQDGVTLTASAKDCFQVQGGSLTLASGTATESVSGKSLVYAASGTLRVTGGSYTSAGNGFWIDNGVDVQLTGGSFTASDKLLRYEGKKASEMLPVDFALSDGSGKVSIGRLNVEEFPGGGPTFTVGPCGHTDADLACTTNGNGTHSVKCRYCRYAQDSAPHTYENGQCPGCNAEIKATVETGGTSYYETIEAAWASLPDGKSTVTLLKGADIQGPLEVSSGKNVTVEMKPGVRLAATVGNCFKVVSGGTLTLTESCNILKASGGNSFVDISAGTLFIRGGTYTNITSNGNGVWAGDNATVQISGGTFTVADGKLLLR